MAREYIAFISYRHLPLDTYVARKLHRRIEGYTIPKDLRKDGRKKPGIVFRDQEELSIAGNLSANIREALDHTRYLIVICTPETSKSPWVLREISYFLEHHDRDHVLAVLADGTPETSFPAQLTGTAAPGDDPDGDPMKRIEPLAANIAAPGKLRRDILFRTESLRVIAALIGCPFDALYRRQQRFRRQRTLIAFTAVIAVASVFIGMLLNRNALIRAQLEQTQINESKTLAALSGNAYDDGDYTGALRYALAALPGRDRERPYVAEAEYVLSRELGPYRTGVLTYTRSLEQDDAIALLSVSDDGTRLASVDAYGALRVWDTTDGTVLLANEDALAFIAPLFLPGEQRFLMLGSHSFALYDAAGQPLWSRPGGLNVLAVSPDGKRILQGSFFTSDGTPERFILIDLTDGTDLLKIETDAFQPRFCEVAALSEDGSRAALLLQKPDASVVELFLWDTAENALIPLASDLPSSPGAVAYALAFGPEGEILLACDNRNGDSFLRLYESGEGHGLRYEILFETEKMPLESGGTSSHSAGIDLLDTADGRIALGCKHDLYQFDLAEGTVLWHQTLPSLLLAGRLYSNACLGLVLDGGLITFCTDGGILSYHLGFYSFESGYPITKAAICGPSFPESQIAIVSGKYPGRASLLRFSVNDEMFPVGAFSSPVSHVSFIRSPDGTLVLAVGYDPIGTPREAVLLDAGEGSTGENFALPDEYRVQDPGSLALTNGGLLLTPSGVLDVRNNRFDLLTLSDTHRCACGSDGVVRSALVEETDRCSLLLFEDGAQTASLPCPEGAWEIAAVGGNGLVLLTDGSGGYILASPDGSFTSLEVPVDGLCALGDEKPLLTFGDGERLLLRDLDSGQETDLGALPPTAAKLLFAENDSLLAVLSENGTLLLFDTAGGVLLHTSEHSGLRLHFRDGFSRFALTRQADGDRLLLFYDDLEQQQLACLVIDKSVWGVAGAYENVGAYLPARNWVVIAPPADGIYVSRLKSGQELIELAEMLTR